MISPDKPLKEAQIAVDVFERRRNFDPQIDPIVRVEAGRLRLRMTEYYAGPGQNDDIIIEIGKGGYFATFNPNTAKPTLQSGNDVAVASAAAYRLYLKGRYFWDKRTPEGLRKASEYFERASALNPAFVRATMGVADCNLVTATFEFAAPTEAIANARKKVEDVLQCNVRSAEARTTLSAIQAFYDRDWSAAEAGFKRAIEIDAKYATSFGRVSKHSKRCYGFAVVISRWLSSSPTARPAVDFVRLISPRRTRGSTSTYCLAGVAFGQVGLASSIRQIGPSS